MEELNRHQIRRITFQTLFSILFNLEINNDRKLTKQIIDKTIKIILQNDDEKIVNYKNINEVEDTVNNILENITSIDLLISTYLDDNWTIDRLSKIDLNLIRLAIYEANYSKIPSKIIVDESMKLAKEFTDEKNRRFINGILNKSLTF